MSGKAPKPEAAKPEPVEAAKPARTLSYGVGNPKQGSGGRRTAPSKDD